MRDLEKDRLIKRINDTTKEISFIQGLRWKGAEKRKIDKKHAISLIRNADSLTDYTETENEIVIQKYFRSDMW